MPNFRFVCARFAGASVRVALQGAALLFAVSTSACDDDEATHGGGHDADAGATAGEAGEHGGARGGSGGSAGGDGGEAGTPEGGDGAGGASGAGSGGRGGGDARGRSAGDAGTSGSSGAGSGGRGGTGGESGAGAGEAGAGGEAGGGAGGAAGEGGGGGTGGGEPQHFPMPMPNPVASGLPNPHDYTALGDGTVHDNVTGLTWMVTPYHGPEGGRGRTISEAREYCAGVELGGYDDWRVPSRIELVSILDYTRSFPAIDPVAFVGEVAEFGSETVSEPSPGGNGYFWVSFLYGDTSWTYSDQAYGYVRCVRPAMAEPNPRYSLGVGSSAGMVLDDLTGLRWQRAVVASAHDWQGASAYCSNLRIGGQSNFRVPSVKELQTIVVEGPKAPLIDDDAFPDTPKDAYLTSSRYVRNSIDVWNVNFVTGTQERNFEHITYRVRCVADDDGTPWTSGPLGPCEGRTCSGHGTCSVVGGNAECVCNTGFARDPADARACSDVNECATNNGGCDPRVACVNTTGGRKCRDCPPGYRGSGETGCTLVSGCPCQNGGLCVEHGTGTACDCPDGFVGATCQTRFAALAPGVGFTCGVRSDGGAQCWGTNSSGQSIAPSGTFKAISAGTSHACAIRSDDTVACWVPTSVPTGTFRAIAAGQQHTCGIRTDGTLACWGSNASGQSTPPSGTFTSVVSGPAHSCAIRTDGTLACWGDSAKSALPSAMAGQVLSAAAIYSRATQPPIVITCGLRASDGVASCWGSSSSATAREGTYSTISGSCGLRTDGTLTCWHTTAPTGTFTSLWGGADHACAIRPDGTVQCFGAASNTGQVDLPSGAFTRASVPCAVRANGAMVCAEEAAQPGTFVDVSSFRATGTAGIRSDGSIVFAGLAADSMPIPQGTFDRVSVGDLYLCGVRTDGRLAFEATGHQFGPFVLPPSGTFIDVVTGSLSRCALATGGRVQCWGDNSYDQSVAPLDAFSAIGATSSKTCAIRQNDSAIVCWGSDGNQAPPPSGAYKAISHNGNCAIRSDGSVVCWPAPPQAYYAPPAGSFDEIAGTPTRGCAIASDMTLHCWGSIVR